jgi:hypothetical protein
VIGIVNRPGREPQDLALEIGEKGQAVIGHRQLRKKSELNKLVRSILANFDLPDKPEWR